MKSMLFSCYQNINYLQNQLSNNFDISQKQFQIQNTTFGILYLSSITDENLISECIVKPLQGLTTPNPTPKMILGSVITSCKAELIEVGEIYKKNNNIITKILKGHIIVFIDNNPQALIIALDKFPSRSPEEPPTASVVYGPRVGFVEDIDKNIGLLRKRLATPKLKFEQLEVGTYTKTKVVIAYLTDIANKKTVKKIKSQLSKINIDGIVDSHYIITYFQKDSLLFRQVGITEKPDVITAKILEGRVAIICDGSPIVLTLPYIVFEDLQNSNDYYTNNLYATFVRFIRLIGIIVAVIAPGVYLSIRLYHFNIMPFKYLITISNSTQGLPFTPFIELIFILILFQVLYEVSLRLPRYLGMATSIVGALILGQTGVSAGLISPPGVVIIAMSIIAVYVVPEQISQLSVLRLIFLIIGGSVGMLGIVGGMIYFINHIAAINNFDAPYLAPYAPRIKEDLEDGLVKQKQSKMQIRPKSISPQKNRRLK